MSDVSVGHFDEQVGCKGNCHSLGEWRHLVSYQVAQSRRIGGHSDMTIGFVPTRSDVSAFLFEHACWIGSSHLSDVSAKPFFDRWLIRYKC